MAPSKDLDCWWKTILLAPGDENCRCQNHFGMDDRVGVALNLCNVKTTWLILGVLGCLVVSSPAQTNFISTKQPSAATQTNLDQQKLAAQREAVRKAMPQYFQIEQDPVNDTKTISLNDYDQLENEDTAHLLIDVVCFIHPPKRLPDKISLHIISHSENWRFLENHDFTIRFDDKKLSPGDLAYANKVLSDATVNEQIWPDFTLDQFRQIAWADKVYFKLGYKNYEIPTVTRQKWKLLWKYLDLMKAGQDVDLKKAIGEKP